MRNGGWLAAAGLGSVVLLLTACGSSSSNSAASTGATQVSTSSSTSTGQASAATSAAATSAAATGGPTTSAPSQQSPQPQASSNAGASFFPRGTIILIVQHSKLGFVLALANGQVVYTYAHDPTGGTPTCTGSCASIWIPVTGVPKVSPGDTIPGTFALVTRSDGTKQVTYNGHPLYTYKGAAALTTPGEGIGGVWNVVMLSASDIG
jgi:predicted lipoprotein with Yx(FWY)xxD motif